MPVTNKYLEGKTLLQVHDFLNRDFVVSRLVHEGELFIPNRDTIFHLGDQMLLVCAEADQEAITAFIGPKLDIDFEQQDQPMVSKRVVITNPKVNGKTLASLHFSSVYGVNVTRVTRHGMDIFASPTLPLQVGDRIMVVGPEDLRTLLTMWLARWVTLSAVWMHQTSLPSSLVSSSDLSSECSQ